MAAGWKESITEKHLNPYINRHLQQGHLGTHTRTHAHPQLNILHL